MNYYLVAIMGLTGAFAILSLTRTLFSPAGLLLLSLVPTMLGFAHYADHSSPPSSAGLVLAFPFVFACGAARTGRLLQSGRPARSVQLGRERGWLAATLLFVAPLVALHFSVVGFAVLSDAVEVQRFTLNSGFGGIPSRIVLFVVPIMTLASSLRDDAPRSARLVLWALFVGSRLAMGFKSGLLEVLIMVVVVAMLRGVVFRFRTNVLILAVTSGALAYANWVGSKYSTLTSSTLSREYLMDRMGRQTAQPALAGLDVASSSSYGSFFLHDLLYFANQYAGLGPFEQFPIDKIVSAALTGTPLAESNFIVPVTLGGPAYTIGTLGGGLSVISLITVVAAFFAIGRIWRRMTTLLEGSSVLPIGRTIFAAAGLLALRSFLVNGGGAYVAINYAASAVLAVAFLAVGSRLNGRARTDAASGSLLVAAPQRHLATARDGSSAPLDG